MDYKYIEQLLERYWECQTTLEEEAILRAFFAQADIPASLLPYRDLFLAEENMQGEGLGSDFDQRVMERITAPTTSAPILPIASVRPLRTRGWEVLRPFYRAAAMVAIALTIGMAAQQGFQRNAEADLSASPALTAESDTAMLFIEQPAVSPQTEAVLATSPADTIITTQ